LKTAVSEKLLAPAAMSAHAGQAGVLSFERQIARTAVHAIGVRQITPTGQGVVCVYVDSPSDDIETRLKEEITLTIGQIPVNVIRCLPARFLGAGALPCCGSDRLDTLRPVIGGISTSHLTGEVGTLGYFFGSNDPSDNPHDIFALSNNHI